MMTLHKLHSGNGYTYLTRQVAAGDEGRSPGQQLSDYYLASGNPPGRWVGAGAADLGVHGRVREDQMRSLFGSGLHPDAEQILALERAAGTNPTDAAHTVKLGRAFPKYTPLPPRTERLAARLSAWEMEHGHAPSPAVRSKIEAQEARKERRAVAGYDLVFTPVKSVSLLWALGSSHARQAVEDAHHEAVADTLAWLERETAFARVGDAGEQQVETAGFIATAFDHRDSRAGDPDLHTHLAVSNKVRARDDYLDGRPRWLSLDARVIHAAAVAASERYNTRLEDALARRLSVDFVERADSVRDDKRPIREVAGIPEVLIKQFSRRRAAIEGRYRSLASDYRRAHGHEPSRSSQLKLAQQATLETREGKGAPRSLADKLADWRVEAERVIGADRLVRLTRALDTDPVTCGPPSDLPVTEIARSVVARVSHEKATWTRWNVLAEIERQLRPARFASPAARQTATDLVVAHALGPDVAVRLTSDGRDEHENYPEPGQLGPAQRRSDGESVFHEHGATRFTTQDLLDAEQRLLDHSAQCTRHGLPTNRVLELVAAFETRHAVRLDQGQRALVLAFTTDPRRLVAGIGPAGAGKTTAMKAVAAAWRTTGRRVIPLAPSASAAEVLSDELGCRAENLHKFRHAHDTATGAPDAPSGPPEDAWFVLEPGDLVLVDEAGLAGTRNLDWLTTYARERGAVVRLLGDPAQLTSVEAGGALRLVAHDAGVVELTDLHRFIDPAEAAATIGIREGRTEALDFYVRHDRIRSGSADAMLDMAFDAWDSDTRAGRSSLLIAQSGRDVIALNVRARTERICQGLSHVDGVELHDGTSAGAGDLIVTRRNDRSLSGRDGEYFVKNGDTWTVTRLHHTGDLTVQRDGGRSVVRLPRSYVSAHVELGYATTAARTQGRTVDTAHVLVNDAVSREALYVSVTRGRAATHLYMQQGDLLGIEPERPPSPQTDARTQLVAVVERESSERTATEVQRDTQRTTEGSSRRQAITAPSTIQRRPVSARSMTR